jgi:hypothetical protein
LRLVVLLVEVRGKQAICVILPQKPSQLCPAKGHAVYRVPTDFCSHN